MQIRTISEELKKIYGKKIYRLSLSSGCTCPNRDGSIGTGGCTFCSEGGSGDFAAPPLLLSEQMRMAEDRIAAKLPKGMPQEERQYIAYFQSFTNTYARDDAELERLEKLYKEAIQRPEIVILSLGTRPDCLGEEIMAMLERVQNAAPEKPIWIELGLQTIWEDTAIRIHRGYALPVFEDAYTRLKAAGFEVIIHLILGLPGELPEDMLESIRYISGLIPPPDGVKLQLLHVLKGTALVEEISSLYEFTPETYTDLVVECLKLLPPETVVHRMTGDGPKRLLITPLWSSDKKRVMNLLNRKISYAKKL